MLTPYNVKAILNNLNLVFKNGDISKLNNPTYTFLHLMSGFIAHYNLGGFQHYYSDLRVLIQDLKKSLPISLSVAYRDLNETPDKYPNKPYNGYGLDYCRSNVEVLEGIKTMLPKYESEITIDFAERERIADLEIANALAQKHGHRVIAK